MNGWTWLALAAATLAGWLAYRRTREVACTIELASTPTDFHADVVLVGVDVNEGDAVLVHGAPDHIGLGEVRTMQATATVQQASWPRRLLVRVLGTSGITELYEVGFEG
ncbi:MAG: hypothetical protein ACKOFO_12980 [Gemmatimonadota bacterium]